METSGKLWLITLPVILLLSVLLLNDFLTRTESELFPSKQSEKNEYGSPAAYLILVHNVETARGALSLIAQLTSFPRPAQFIVVHVDRKVAGKQCKLEYEEGEAESCLQWLRRRSRGHGRVHVISLAEGQWGGWGLVQVQLVALEYLLVETFAANPRGDVCQQAKDLLHAELSLPHSPTKKRDTLADWDFVINLSGDAFPLKSNEFLADWLEKHNTACGIKEKGGRPCNVVSLALRPPASIDSADSKADRYPRRHLTPDHGKVYFGSQWFILSRSFLMEVFCQLWDTTYDYPATAASTNGTLVQRWVRYFQENSRLIINTVPDESFFQTLLMNMPQFAETTRLLEFEEMEAQEKRVFVRSENWDKCSVYYQGQHANPCFLTKKDWYENLKKSETLYARKFFWNDSVTETISSELRNSRFRS